MSSTQWDQLAVDAIVLLHFSFVVFVLFGGVLLIWWRKIAWLHIPAVVWGALIEFTGWICPLTPLENRLRDQAGLEMYEGDFVMRYIMPVLYPEDLTRSLQIVIGLIVVLINLGFYSYVFIYRKSNTRSH